LYSRFGDHTATTDSEQLKKREKSKISLNQKVTEIILSVVVLSLMFHGKGTDHL